MHGGELSVRQYLDICVVWRILWYEVLPYRQLFSFDIPRASPSVTTASLSIALQAIPPHVLEDNRENDADAMRKCLFPVYRLAVDAKPVGWWWSGLKISELAQGFSDGYAINGSQRHSHQQQGVYLGFCQSVTFLNDNTSSTFLNDNIDNRNNGKNRRNCGCHEVTYNKDNGDYFCNRECCLCCYRCLCCLLK